MADYSHETCHVAYPVHVVFEHGGVNAADELEREPDRPNREDRLCNVAEKYYPGNRLALGAKGVGESGVAASHRADILARFQLGDDY